MKKRNCISLILIMFMLIFCAAPVLAANSKTDGTSDTAAATAENNDDAAKTGGLIALSFDDGPSVYTNKLLDALKERDAEVTFFVVGSRVQQYAPEIKREYAEGHEIGCHTWCHTNLTKLDAAGIKDEVDKTKSVVSDVLGVDMSRMLLRPPGGSYNETVLANAGSPVLLWSVDPKDWKYRDAEAVKNSIVNYACDGAIMDLHDLYDTSVDGTVAAIDELQKQGYTFVTISELFRRKGMTLEVGNVYLNAPDNGVDLGPLPEETNHESDDDTEKDSGKDTGKDAFPWGLLIFCAIVLLLYFAGMTRLFLVYKPQKEIRRNETKNLRHDPSGHSDTDADGSASQRRRNRNGDVPFGE